MTAMADAPGAATAQDIERWMVDPAAPGRTGPGWWRRQSVAWRRWLVGSLFGDAFLIGAVVSLLTAHGTGRAKIISLVCVAVLAALYSYGTAVVLERDRAARFAVLAAEIAVVIPIMTSGWTDATSLWLFAGITGGMLLRIQEALVLAVALGAAMLIVGRATGHGMPFEMAFVLVALTAWMGAFAGNIALAQELRRTRQALADSAVADERLRIGRDLHDILGHSLTAITIKAGLAGRLLDRDPAAARRELAEIESMAREAVADVRATAAGYRDLSLAGELAVAGSVLRAAGYVAELPSAVDDVSPAARSVFGYVVRESVTNVVRHSGGTWCAITLTPETVTVLDNGSGRDRLPVTEEVPGSGLTSLAERLREAGGTLEAGPRPDGGFRVFASIATTAPVLAEAERSSGPAAHPAPDGARTQGLIGR